MNGAYGDQPELRPPGIKASLRFWWRALHGHLSLDDLRKQESAIFGSTKGRSRVLIRMDVPIDEKPPIKTPLLPHKTEEFKKSPASAFASGVTFGIRLDFDKEVISVEKMKNLFILACTLGGWGKRSRRGFGSVAVTGVEINGKKEENFKMPETTDGIYALLDRQYFEKANNTIYSNFRRNEPYPYLKSIEVGKEFSSIPALLESIGKASSKMKRDNNDNWDYRNGMGHVSKRLASPVFTSIILKNGLYHPIFTVLNTERPLSRSGSEIQNNYKAAINP